MTSNEFGVIFPKSGIAILSLGPSLPPTAFEGVSSVLHRIHAPLFDSLWGHTLSERAYIGHLQE
jgi:hypothetical protein